MRRKSYKFKLINTGVDDGEWQLYVRLRLAKNTPTYALYPGSRSYFEFTGPPGVTSGTILKLHDSVYESCPYARWVSTKCNAKGSKVVIAEY